MTARRVLQPAPPRHPAGAARTWLLGAVAAVLATLTWLQYGAAPASGIAAPVRGGAAARHSAGERAAGTVPFEVRRVATTAEAPSSDQGARILAVNPREPASEDEAAAFAPQRWEPPAPPPPRPQPPAEPRAPPLPFKFLGKQLDAGGWTVFLAQGERTLLLKAESDVDGVYRVREIAPPTMTLVYLPLNETQTIEIGAAPQ